MSSYWPVMPPQGGGGLYGGYTDQGGGQMPRGPGYLTEPNMMGAGGLAGASTGMPPQGGGFWAGTDANSTALRNLYGGVGKTGGMIDKEGWDFWSGKQAAGEDISGAFGASANQVYNDTLAGKPSQYQGQNIAGMRSMLGQQNLSSYSPSPYLGAQADDIGRRTQEMLGQNNNAIRGSAIMAGGLGGGRQAIAEAGAAGKAADYLSGNLANLYGQDYQAQMGRNLSQYGMDQANTLGTLNSDRSFQLGQGAQNLQGQGQAMNFYTQQRGQDQSGAALGAALYGQGVNGPWNPVSNANSILAPYAGNGTTTTSSNSGGGWQGGLGGAIAGAAAGRQFNWW
jgi:hypothetical protein